MPAVDPNQAVRALTLGAHAITMDTLAPYNTLQLVATARNAAGAPLPGAPAATFTTSDSSVRVSATGLLTARAVTNDVQVVATLVYQGVRLVDTAVITVTGAPAPPAFQTLDFGLMAEDSARLPTPVAFSSFYAAESKTLRAAARDALGQPIPGASVALRTSAPGYATLPAITRAVRADVTFTEEASHPGPVWVYASATVYGVTKQDSLELMLTPPVLQVYALVPGAGGHGAAFAAVGAEAVVGAGGAVWWSNTSPDSLNVAFDDPTAAEADPGFFGLLNTGGGDIAVFPGCTGASFGCIRSRRFPRVGTFAWHSSRTGLSGRIRVQ